jgi:hypothetical protein
LTYSATGSAFIVKSASEAIVEVGILPILLERKRLILERISALTSSESLMALKESVSRVTDPDVRLSLETQIENYEAQSEQLRQETVETEAQKAEAITSAQAETLKVNIFKERANVWLQILGRESVASVVGALLLITFAIAVIVAMFTHVAASTVISDSFLLILGYFFGQGVARHTPAGDSRSEKTTIEAGKRE